MTVAEAFGDVAEILAEMAPSKIMEIRPSKDLSDRVEALISKKKKEKFRGKKRLSWSVIWHWIC